MGIRKGIFIVAAMLSIMACTACGNSGGNVSETNSAETSTGVESGIIEQPQVMYDGHIYYYNATGRDEKLPEGYEIAGTIKRVDSKDYPAENFAAAGVDLEAGQEIYISTTEKNVIYLKYDSGYARFERRPEEATEKAQDETKSAEKENEIEGNSEMTAYMDASMEEDYGEDGEFDFDSIFGIDQLDLNYEAHVAGFDGESFLYSVHIDGGVTDEKVDEIQQVMADYSSQNGDEENYMGYTRSCRK